MKYTTNYHLPQWVEDDLILMDDFNRMNANIENGIDGVRAEALQAAAEAQAAANSAKVTANAAQSAAATLPYAVGSYVGTGGDVDIHLGFRPSFVIICGQVAGDALNTDTKITYVFGATGGQVIQTRITLTSTGFRACSRDSGDLYPDFSLSGRRYDYIAFK